MALVEVRTVDHAITVVEMNDPGRYNALTDPMVTALKETFAFLRRDRATRVIVLGARGKGFCSGANMAGGDDLGEQSRDRGPVGLIQMAQEHFAELVLAIRETPQPVIAAVHGGAVGGGFALALACDLRVVSDDAFLSSHFIRVGLSSCDLGTSYMLPRIVGVARAAELMLTGRRVEAIEAERIGLVNRIVSRDKLLDAACELGASITANSEYGVYMTKLGLWANVDAPSLRHAMELENRTQVLGCFTANMTEAGRAFVERRDPEWKPM